MTRGPRRAPARLCAVPPSHESLVAGGEETGKSAGARREETLSGTVKRKSPPAPGPVETRAAPARYEDITPGAVPTGYEDITAGAACPADPVAPTKYEDITPGAVPAGYEDITAGATGPSDEERPAETPVDRGTALLETLCGPPSYEDITAGEEDTGESPGGPRTFLRQLDTSSSPLCSTGQYLASHPIFVLDVLPTTQVACKWK